MTHLQLNVTLRRLASRRKGSTLPISLLTDWNCQLYNAAQESEECAKDQKDLYAAMVNESEAKMDDHQDIEKLAEIAVVGDLTDNEEGICEKLLDIEMGGECILYFDTPGGNSYAAISLLTIIVMRKLKATGIVTGECSSAALWPFAACQRRIVTPFSVMLFHPMKWQSEENVQWAEAAEWARHFQQLERNMDELLASFLGISLDQLNQWTHPGRFVDGKEFAAAGLAELHDLKTARSLSRKQLTQSTN